MTLLWLAASCSSVHSTAEAPFDLDGRTMLFMADEGADQRAGAGVLLITDEELDCDDMPRSSYADVLKERLNGDGRGLTLLALYSTTGDAVFGRRPWQGLYTTSRGVEGSASDQRTRSLVPRAFDRGFEYLIDPELDGSSWFSVDEIEADILRGEFHTPWWRGRVEARICVEPGQGGPVDCTPDTPEAFYDAFANVFCKEWDACADDQACPIDDDPEEAITCEAFDRDVAAACVCGEWQCLVDFPGVSYPEPPVECAFVCGDFFYQPGY